MLDSIQAFCYKFLIDLNAGLYHIISYIYQIFIFLAETNIFDEGEYQKLVVKVYTILGVVVLFIMAYNILTYIVDPDKDKNFTASGKFIKEIIVTFAMILACPYLFSFAYGIQTAVLKGGAIQNFFTDVSSAEDAPMTLANGGRVMAADTFFTFMTGDAEQTNQSESKMFDHTTTYKCDSKTIAECQVQYGVTVSPSSDEGPCIAEGTNIVCRYSINCAKEGSCTFADAQKYSKVTGVYAPLKAFSMNIAKDAIEFNWLLCLVAGCYMVYVLLSFSFDLAVRIAKLCFYQILAPITIATRIMPGGEVKKIFTNWFSAVKTTYFMVFIRVFVMALGIYLIDQFENSFIDNFFAANTDSTGDIGVKFFARVLIFMGILTFLKEAPKLVQEVFGIKDIKMGFASKIKDALTPPAGVLRTGAMMGGAITAGVRNRNHALDNKKGFWRTAASTIAGAASGGYRSMMQAKDAKSWRDMVNSAGSGAAAATNVRDGREAKAKRYKANGMNGFSGRWNDAKELIDQWATGGTSKYDSIIKVSSDIKSKKDAMDSEAKKLLAKYGSDEDLIKDIDPGRFKTAATKQIHHDLLEKTGKKISFDAIDQMLKTMQEQGVDRGIYYKHDNKGNIIPGSFDQAAYDAAVRKNAQDVSNMRSYRAQLEKELMLNIEDHAIRGQDYGSISAEKLMPVQARATEMVQLFEQNGGQIKDSYTGDSFDVSTYRKVPDMSPSELANIKTSNAADYLDKISGAYDNVKSQASAEQAKIIQTNQAIKTEKGDKK